MGPKTEVCRLCVPVRDALGRSRRGLSRRVWVPVTRELVNKCEGVSSHQWQSVSPPFPILRSPHQHPKITQQRHRGSWWDVFITTLILRSISPEQSKISPLSRLPCLNKSVLNNSYANGDYKKPTILFGCLLRVSTMQYFISKLKTQQNSIVWRANRQPLQFSLGRIGPLMLHNSFT